MTDDVEMKAWGKSHIGFESERFLLLAPAAHGPLHRERRGNRRMVRWASSNQREER